MLAYTAGDALNAITREFGVASTPDREEVLAVSLNPVKQLVGRLVAALRQFRSPSDLDDYAF